MQFRCVCKSWNSLITDSKFANIHLRFSTTRLVHSLTSSCYPLHRQVINSHPLGSVFSDLGTNVIVHIEYPPNPSFNRYVYIVGLCNGILCLAQYYQGCPFFQLWHPMSCPLLKGQKVFVMFWECMVSAMMWIIRITRLWLFHIYAIVVVILLKKTK